MIWRFVKQFLSLISDVNRLVYESSPTNIFATLFYAEYEAPIFEITPVDSSIKFHVKTSTTIPGKFDKWEATQRSLHRTRRRASS